MSEHQRALLLCARVGETPAGVVAGSLQKSCSFCGAAVWASRLSFFQIVTENANYALCCLECAPTEAQGEELQFIPPGEGIQNELRAAGVPQAFIDAIVRRCSQ